MCCPNITATSHCLFEDCCHVHTSINIFFKKRKPFFSAFVLSIHTQTLFYATKFFKIFWTAVTAKICKNKCALLLCSYQEAEQQLHFIMCQHAGITFYFLFAAAWLMTFSSGYQLTANEVTNSHHKTETNSLHVLRMCFSEFLFIKYQLLLLVVVSCGEIFHSQTAKLNFLFF